MKKTQEISDRIMVLRGLRVMLSSDLALLYGVAPKVLNQAVKRNIERFPSDFMFQLNPYEFANLKSQVVTSSWGGLRRARPYAFTEHGVVMLSSVLQSRKAIAVNIAIVRAFVKLRNALYREKDLAYKVERLEGKVELLQTDVRLMNEDVRALKQRPEVPSPLVRGFMRAD